MKRLLLMLSLVVGLASTALAVDKLAYTITFKTGNNTGGTQAGKNTTVSDVVETGSASFISSLDTKTKVFPTTANGVRVGATTGGKFVFTLADPVQATKIVFVGKTYGGSKNTKLTKSQITFNNVAGEEHTYAAGASVDYTDTFVLNGSELTKFTIEVSTGIFISAIEVYTSDSVIPVAPKMPVVTFGDVTAENNGEYQVVAGTEVTVTSTGAERIIVSNTTDDGQQTVEGDTYNFTVDADEMYEFTGENNVGSSDKFAVTFTVVEAPKTGGVVYTLVKSAGELVAGETYTIACAEFNKAMSNANQANYRQSVDANIANGSFEATKDVLAFTLEKNSDKWNISTLNYAGTDGYFDLSSSATDFKITNTETGYNVIIDENANVKIASGSRTIRYNSSSPRFAMYLSSATQGKDVQLYREEVVAPAIYLNGEQLQAGATPELKAGDKIVIRGHEANELHYKLLNSAMRAPSANLDGWFKHDSNEFEYEVPEGFENESISLAAKAVNNGKESAPVQFVVSEGTMTGVAGVEAEAAEAQTEWFTLQGVRVAAPAEGGLYIRRQGSKVEKVVL